MIASDGRPVAPATPAEFGELSLVDWRNQIAAVYAQVRGARDCRAAHAQWLARRSELFAHHPMSPLCAPRRASFSAITAFDYDPSWRCLVGVVPLTAPVRSVQLGADGELRLRPAMMTNGLAEQLGRELTIFALCSYGGGLFLPFGDATNGRQTYGGGRYLLDTIKGADLGLSAQGQMILDFNFAYHPSCALNETYICPLTPPENRVDVAVTAGEQLASG